MSLINQMLKDIDKRQGLPSSTFSDDAGYKPSMPRARSVSPARLVVWGGGLVLAVGAVGYGVYQWRLQGASPQALPAQASAVKPVSAPLEAPVMTAITVDDKGKGGMPAETASEGKKAPVTVAAAEEPKPALKAPAAAPAPTAASKETPAPASARPAPAPAPAPVAAAAAAVTKAPAANKPAVAAAAPGLVSRVISAEQRADNAYREAVASSRQGRSADVQRQLRQALAEQASHHEARLMLAQLLTDEGRRPEAMALLNEGLSLKPTTYQMHLALAQAQLLSKETDAAVATLERGWTMGAEHAPYQALMATALQQQGRHPEAVQYFVQALRQQPESSHWLVGLGVSLQATGNNQGASEAYQRALDLGLSATLGQFARDKLRQLGR